MMIPSRGNGRCEAGEERVEDESRGKKAVSRVVGLSAATSSGGGRTDARRWAPKYADGGGEPS